MNAINNVCSMVSSMSSYTMKPLQVLGLNYAVDIAGTDSRGNQIFCISDMNKMLDSISSVDDIDAGPAYKLDLNRKYASNEEYTAELKRVEALCRETSIAKAYKADIISRNCVDNEYSAAAYLGMTREYQVCNDRESISSFWAGFKADATYQKYAQRGGTQNENEVEELVAAAQAYRWRTAYKMAGVYQQDMYDFADKLETASGMRIITRGDDNYIDIRLNNRLAAVDNYTFQFMAKHQEQMDLWVQAVTGEISSFAELSDRIMSTYDELLKQDWRKYNNPSNYTHEAVDIKHREAYFDLWDYVSVSYNRDAEYDSQLEGTTGHDFWSEFLFNTGLIDNYVSHRDINEWANDLPLITDWKLDDEFHRQSDAPYHYVMDSTDDNLEQQVEALKEKIKVVREKISALQTGEQLTEKQEQELEGYRKEMQGYQSQVAILQMDRAEHAKSKIMG